MKRLIWILWQCLWGFPQTLTGAVLLLLHHSCPRGSYRNAFVVYWNHDGSTSLGPFLFMEEDAESCPPLFVHEYGHCMQSAVLGILYLPLIYIPSVLWYHLPFCRKIRKNGKMGYYRFYTESWANIWGEKVTGKKSMR